MKKLNVTIIFLTLSFFLQGCATTSRDKILQGMFVAGTVGTVYGLSKESDRQANAALYGGLAAATAGVVGLMLENPDTEVKRLREEVSYLKNQRELKDETKLVAKSPAIFNGQIPEKYRGMINPGEWKVYEVDQWEEESENRLRHVDRVMELRPPSLVPLGK